MDWADISARLQDLPSTYRRRGPNYTAWQNSLTAAISRGTTGVDSVIDQINFATSSGKWLDVWGAVLNVPRHAGEGSQAYRSRIAATCQAWRVTPPGIEDFVEFTRGIAAQVTESIPTAVGWQLVLSANSSTLQSLAADLQVCRPAGVPYAFALRFGGLYLDTVNFLGRPRTTGAYLSAAVKLEAPGIGPATNNVVNTLPTTLLTDPTLNPSLST